MNTREQWLMSALALITAHLKETANVVVPDTTRVSCGLAGGRIGAKRIGECWSVASSADGSTEIFISPTLSAPNGNYGVLAVLVHEAIHAALGVAVGHKAPFKRAALAVGLEGKMTATTATAELQVKFASWMESLGEYPHASLSAAGRKKQGTRLIKVVCKECGYTLRTCQKWIDLGLPRCYCNEEEMSVESASGDDE